jgi:putrescine transport system permease protein
MLDAAWVTPPRRALSATLLATMLGTLAALALVRYGRFRGRHLFSGMVMAPLVMPEVITGLSLLCCSWRRCRARLLDRDDRPYHLHHVLRLRWSCSRGWKKLSFDRSLEEAAMDARLRSPRAARPSSIRSRCR